MNSKLINLTILVLFVVFTCIPDASAINCYNCDSRNNTNCLTSPGKSDEMTCPPFITSCLKVFGKLNDQEYVARGCNLAGPCAISGISAIFGNFKYQVDCANCDGNLCNSADTLIKSKQIGFVGVLVAFMLKKLLF